MRGPVVLLCAALSLSACKHEQTPKRLVIPGTAARPVAAKALAKVVASAGVKIHIEGMKCAMGCARAIEHKLRQTPGVAKAVVNFKAKQATVSYDKAETDVDKLLQVITAAGDYKAKVVDAF